MLVITNSNKISNIIDFCKTPNTHSTDLFYSDSLFCYASFS